MKTTLLRYRRVVIVVLHLGLTLVSYYAAFLLRLDGQLPPEYVVPFVSALPWLLGIRGVTFWAFHLYQGLWRYAGIWDLRNIIFAVILSSAAFALLVQGLLDLVPYPRSVYFIDSVLLICLLGGARLARRVFREFDRLQSEKRILIFGAGDAGELIVRDMRNNRYYNSDPIGFIDDDASKVGRRIHGVKVLGTSKALPRVIAARQPHEVLVAIPTAEPSQFRAIVKSLEPFDIPIKTLPNLRDALDGKVELSQIRNLSLEDLMSRKPVGLDPEPLREFINGRRVLVTGAGGSIGSELARQLVHLGPAKLVLLERYENSLFDVCNDLELRRPRFSYEPVIGDVTDAAMIDRVFQELRPDVVFHAAAHKHVPLMELNPAEAVKNNVRGTRIVAEAAARYGVGEFVLISSDKAVNPSSVMGATKRVGEQIIRSLNEPGGTRFVAVRFGNVLGSNGSVTDLFTAQVARGGPVTVTHPDMRRYFMLIPEAVQLVLHAAAMRDTGTIYVLDMGEQIRIWDLARSIIRLSGFVPNRDIKIECVGLRPGEKLFEKLVEEGESSEPSVLPKVLRVTSPPVQKGTLIPKLAPLEQAANEGRRADMIRLLSEIVPTFRANTPSVTPERKEGNVLQMPGRSGGPGN